MAQWVVPRFFREREAHPKWDSPEPTTAGPLPWANPRFPSLFRAFQFSLGRCHRHVTVFPHRPCHGLSLVFGSSCFCAQSVTQSQGPTHPCYYLFAPYRVCAYCRPQHAPYDDLIPRDIRCAAPLKRPKPCMASGNHSLRNGPKTIHGQWESFIEEWSKNHTWPVGIIH